METTRERPWETSGPRSRLFLVVTLVAALVIVISRAMPGIVANGYPAQGLHLLSLQRLSGEVARILPGLVIVTVVLIGLNVVAARLASTFGRRKTADGAAAAVVALAVTALLAGDLSALEQRTLIVVAVVAIVTFRFEGWRRFSILTGWPLPLLSAALLVAAPLVSSVLTRRARSAVASKPHVVVLMIDALRADHVTALGYDRPTTPVLDALAEDGILFTQAVSNSNYTRATVTSFFTMLFPSQHGIVHHDDVLSDRHATLAEILRNAGYRTAAFIPNPNMKEIFNVQQGFHLYDNSILDLETGGARPKVPPAERFETADRINDRTLAWLGENRDERTFLYLHYTDVHAPYVPPSPFDTMFDAEAREPRPIQEHEYRLMHKYQRLTDDGGDLNHYINRYDGEIRYADMRLGELIHGLEEIGVLDETLFVVTADHGEAFLEHGYWEHAETLHDEMVHVPLVVRMPQGRHAGARLDAPVHTFDVAATVLDLLDIDPPDPVEARSLLPLISGESDTVWLYSFLENLDRGTQAIRTPRWKLILNRHGREELYDLVADPAETSNLVSTEVDVAAELRGWLGESIDRMNRWRRREGGTTELDSQTLDELRALGYVD